MRSFCNRLRQSDAGATAIEYGLIVAMIALGIMTGLSALGGGSTGLWGQILAKVSKAMGG